MTRTWISGPEAGSSLKGMAVSFAGVDKTYQTSKGVPVRALDGLTLEVPAGQAVAIEGRSGSGKSTLLYLAGAMTSPDSGQVRIGDHDLTSMPERDRAVVRRRVGFIFQRFHLLPALTAADNVVAPLLPLKARFDPRERAMELLSAVGLAGREHDVPGKLSGGEQQRVAIARALVNQPGLVLADEPTGNLDSQTGSQVMDLLFSLRVRLGFTLLVATHDGALAARCERIIRLTDGHISADLG